MPSDSQLATATPQPFVKASTSLSHFLGVEPSMMIETIKRQCFRSLNPDQVSDAQLAAFVSVCNGLKLNPLIPGHVYAYPERNGGMTPIIGPDGFFKLLIEHPEVDSWETIVYPEDVSLPPTHSTTKIWRKGRDRPISYTALMSEWRVSNNPNWQTRPRHMLGIRSLKQAGRQIIHGLPWDEDERHIAELSEKNVTPGTEPETPVKRNPPPKRSQTGAAAVVENAPPKEEKKADVIDIKTQEPVTVPEVMPAETPKAEDPAPAQSQPVMQRTSLADKETITAVCKLIECTPTTKGNMNLLLEGEYKGEAFHMGAAKDDRYKNGVTMRLTLNGKLSEKTKVIYVMVEKADVITEDPE